MSLGKLTKIYVDPTPAVLAELESCFGAKIGEGVPEVAGYYDGRGKLRRLIARYENASSLRINIDAKGYVTSTSVSIKLSSQLEGKSA